MPTVVIPTHGRAESLRLCLAAMARQTLAPSEVVVVDDASSDHTEEVVREAEIPVTLVRFERNAGPAAARNAGIAASSGGLVAFTDDDCEPEPGWLEALARAAESGCAGVGGSVIAAEDHLIARYLVRQRALEPPADVGYLVTCNCAYRRDVLLEVAGFDPRIRGPGGEDPELSARVRALGHELRFEPGAIVRHRFRRGVVDFARTFFRYGYGGGQARVEATAPGMMGELVGDGLPAGELAASLALRALHVAAYRAGWAAGTRRGLS